MGAGACIMLSLRLIREAIKTDDLGTENKSRECTSSSLVPLQAQAAIEAQVASRTEEAESEEKMEQGALSTSASEREEDYGQDIRESTKRAATRPGCTPWLALV